MYKKILAPLDGSELSECTLGHLKAIAIGCHVPEVVLLMVVEPMAISEVMQDVTRKANELALASAKRYLDQVAEKLRKEGINASVAIQGGQAGEKILEYIEHNEIDLVIMGTHGRSGFTRWMMGSIADKIVSHSRVPVLTVTPVGCRA